MEANGTHLRDGEAEPGHQAGCRGRQRARRPERDRRSRQDGGAARRGRAGGPFQLRDHQARSRGPLPRRAGRAGRRSRADRPRGRHACDGHDARHPHAHHVPPGRAGRLQRRGDSAVRQHLHRHAGEQVDAGAARVGLRAEAQRLPARGELGGQLLRHWQPQRAELHRSRRRRRLRYRRRLRSGTATRRARTRRRTCRCRRTPSRVWPARRSRRPAPRTRPTTTSWASRTCSPPSRRPE